MDVRFLLSFVTVVDSGSIADAARRLDLAPTTVAQQLRALEAELGCKLLTRAGRTVKPTVTGSRVVDHARNLLHKANELRSAASDTGLPAGPLKLGATPTALMGLLPPLMKYWMQNHPEIQLYIEPGTSSFLLDRVIAGHLDAAILVHPDFELPKTCQWNLIREEPLMLLTRSEQLVSDPLKTAEQEPFILYDRKVVGGKLVDDYLRSHAIRPKVQFELDGIEHIAQLVAEGFGVSILPDWPITGPQDLRLKRWKLPSPCPARRIGMVWLRFSPRSPLVEAFNVQLENLRHVLSKI